MLRGIIYRIITGRNPLAKIDRDLRKVSSYFEKKQTFSESIHVEYNQQKKIAFSECELKEKINEFPTVQAVQILDGDTVIVGKGLGEIVIRLDSIDCPESCQDWGEIAKYGLIKLIGGKKVRLEEHGFDTHGRTLATIFVFQEDKGEWLNVNERMVTLGHAWVMRRYYDHLPKDRQDKLNRLERWAKSKKVGLWREANPIPPWEWRKG